MKELLDKNIELNQKKSDLENNLSTKENDLNKQIDINKKQKEDYDKLEKDFNKKGEKIKLLEEEKIKKIVEVNGLKKGIDELRNNLNGKLIELNNKYKTTTQNLQNKEKEYMNLKQIEENERKEIINLKNSFNNQNNQLKQYINSKEIKEKELEKKLKEKENENAEMKATCFLMKEELDKEKKNNKIFKDEINAFKNKENNYLNNLQNFQNELNRYKEIINKNKIEMENNQKKIEQLLNEIEKIKFKPLIGLNNIGATCFMNSILQCLSQTKELSKYFLDEKNKNLIINNNIAVKNRNKLQLSPVYFELISQLWDTKNKNPLSPHNFMNTVEKMNSLFKQGQAGDSKDFIIFILEQLHKELKKPINNINNNNNLTNQPLNQYDKLNAFNHFFKSFTEECSIISDLFFGFIETTNECLNCKNNYMLSGLQNPICYNYQIFNCLIFPLEEVKNMKNNNNSLQFNNYIQMNQNNRVSLFDCFSYYQKTDYFTGPNQNYCNICKQLYDSNYTKKIYVSPNILVLILNRGKGNIYDVKLDFTEVIDITQFVLTKDKPQIIYTLYGVITHIGQSGPNSHFVASCKSIDNKWYRFNDSIVHPINNLQKEVIDFGTPYILFYKKYN